MYLLSNEEIKKNLGNRIKRYRIDSGYSQKELSVKTGVSFHSISNIENGKGMAIENLIKILRYFNLLDNLLNLVPEVDDNPYDIAAGIENRQRRKRT